MKPLFTRLALVLAFLTALSASAHAYGHGHNDGHGPDFWRVYNVASWDVLNVRTGPGVSYPVVDALERDNFMDAAAAKDWGLVDEIVENRPRDEDGDW